MNAIQQFVVGHTTVLAVGSMWLFSNIVTALPSPSNASGNFYKFFFAFAQGLAGSLPRVFPAARVFNDPTSGSGTYFRKPNGNSQPPASGGAGQP